MDLNKVHQEITCDDCSLVFPGYKQFLLHRKCHTSLLPSITIKESLLEQSCPLCLIKYFKKYKDKNLERLLGSGRILEASEQKNKSKQIMRCKYYPKCNVEFFRILEFVKHAKDVHNDDKPYNCQRCSFAAPRFYELKQHLYTHWRFKSFKCHLCPKMYATKGRFRDHLLKHEEGSIKSQGCSFCGEKFAEADDLRMHLRIHFPSSETCKCHLCSKELYSKKNLQAHLRGHYKMFKCELCPREYATRTGLKSHVLSSHKEINIKSHNCSYCDKRFLRPIELKTHLRRHHSPLEKSHDCSYCDKKSSPLSVHTTKCLPSEQKLEDDPRRDDSPLENVTAFICYTCSKQFASSESLRRHQLKHTGNEPLTCEYCGKKFPKRFQLRKHQLIHLDRPIYECKDCGHQFLLEKSLEKHCDPEKESKKILRCKKCPKTFKNLNCFTYHDRTHREFLCEVCKKKYFTPEGFKRHLETHGTKLNSDSCSNILIAEKSPSSEGPLICSFCPKVYRNKRSFKSHLQKHEGKEPHVCKYCGKRFIKAKFLKIHLSPEKETKHLLCCKECSETFKNINCFQHHKLSHMGGIVCKVCKVKCYTREGIKQHLAKHGINSEPTL